MHRPTRKPANPVKVPECNYRCASQHEDSGKGDQFPAKRGLWPTRLRFIIGRGNRGTSRRDCWRGANDSNWPYEAVALTDNGLQKPRIIWVIAQGQPNFANCGVDALLSVEKDVLPPQPSDDFFAANQLVSSLNQQD